MGETTETSLEEKVESCKSLLETLNEMRRQMEEYDKRDLQYQFHRAKRGYEMLELGLRRYPFDIQEKARKRMR